MSGVRIGCCCLVVGLMNAAALADCPAPGDPGITDVFNQPGTQITAKDNVIVLIHGWTSNPTYWANGLRTSLINRLGADANKWDIWCLDWETDAAGTGGIFDTSPSQMNELRSQIQGQFVAKTLLAQNYKNIHIYGHSLGGRVTETAATILSQATNAPIETTFLDAYTPYGWDLVYGSTSTWSEHVVNTDDVPYTKDFFPNAYNIDVTAPKPPQPADWPADVNYGHNWPRVWMKNTVDNYVTPNTKYAGLGYPIEMEKDPANFAPAAAHPRGVVDVFGADEDTIDKRNNAPGQFLRNTAVVGPTVCDKSDNVVVDNGIATLTSAADQNEWVNFDYTTSQTTDYIEFEFEFTTDVSGLLSFRWDNDLTWAARDQFALTNQWEKTGKIMWRNSFGNRAAGAHTLSFRLDGGSSGSSVELRTFSTGLLTVPEPGVGAVLMIGVMICTRRKRRADL